MLVDEQKPLQFDYRSLTSMGLTPREVEVLAWVAEGKSNKDVGVILGIRAVTVKKHLEHVFQKIGVETRTAAVAFVFRASRQLLQKMFFLPFVSDLVDDLLFTTVL